MCENQYGKATPSAYTPLQDTPPSLNETKELPALGWKTVLVRLIMQRHFLIKYGITNWSRAFTSRKEKWTKWWMRSGRWLEPALRDHPPHPSSATQWRAYNSTPQNCVTSFLLHIPSKHLPGHNRKHILTHSRCKKLYILQLPSKHQTVH